MFGEQPPQEKNDMNELLPDLFPKAFEKFYSNIGLGPPPPPPSWPIPWLLALIFFPMRDPEYIGVLIILGEIAPEPHKRLSLKPWNPLYVKDSFLE